MGRHESHDFFCCNCGRQGLPIARPAARKRERFHLKDLYCIYCKTNYNHVEVTNSQEKQEFLENFTEGVYENVKQKTISNVRARRIG